MNKVQKIVAAKALGLVAVLLTSNIAMAANPLARKWTIAGGDWAIKRGKLVGGPTIGQQGDIYVGNPPLVMSGNTRIKMEFKFLSTPEQLAGNPYGYIGNHGGINFFASAIADRANITGYTIDWISQNPFDGTAGYRLIRWDGNGHYQVLVGNTPDTVPAREWEIRVIDSTIEFYADDRLVFTYEDGTYRNGIAGIWYYLNGTSIAVDEFRVDRLRRDNMLREAAPMQLHFERVFGDNFSQAMIPAVMR